jgi:hypothetical protein
MIWLKQVFRNFGVLDNVDEAGVDIIVRSGQHLSSVSLRSGTNLPPLVCIVESGCSTGPNTLRCSREQPVVPSG